MNLKNFLKIFDEKVFSKSEIGHFKNVQNRNPEKSFEIEY